MSIVLPESTSKLGNYTFFNCTSLEQIALPNNLEVLGMGCFKGCASLKEATLKDTAVTELPNELFSGCTSLVMVTLNDATNMLGNNVFENCSALAKLNSENNEFILKDATSIIGTSVFKGCTALEKIRLSKEIETISANAFEGCTNLKEVELAAGTRLQVIGNSAFAGCSKLETFAFGAEPTIISRNAFQNCVGLTSMYIPRNVTEAEAGAFTGCANVVFYFENIGVPTKFVSPTATSSDNWNPAGCPTYVNVKKENIKNYENIIQYLIVENSDTHEKEIIIISFSRSNGCFNFSECICYRK